MVRHAASARFNLNYKEIFRVDSIKNPEDKLVKPFGKLPEKAYVELHMPENQE